MGMAEAAYTLVLAEERIRELEIENADLRADLADADNTAVLQSKAILDGEAERDRMKAVYDAAVAWRELERWYSAHTRGTLLAAVTAAEGK